MDLKLIGLHKGRVKTQINNNKQNVGIYLDRIIQFIPKSSHLENKNVIFTDYKIINMSYIFNECSSLKEINFLPSFHTNNVTDTSNMFSNCYCLKNINLSSFNTRNVEIYQDYSGDVSL